MELTPWKCKHCGATLGLCMEGGGLLLVNEDGKPIALLPPSWVLLRVVVRCLTCNHTRDWLGLEDAAA